MNYVNHNKLKFKSDIFKSSNKSIFFDNPFDNFFSFIYIKISKNLLAKCYQENKERLQKKARERNHNLSKEEKEKASAIWSWILQKSLRRWKKLVEYRKKYYRMRKIALS